MLSLAQELVQQQGEVYRRLGLNAPTWAGRALGVKEVEHSLCEYIRFKRLQSTAKARGPGFRSTVSSEDIDDDKKCRSCNCDDGYYCDTCLNLFCGDCLIRMGIQPPDVNECGWICHRCLSLEKHQFENGGV